MSDDTETLAEVLADHEWLYGIGKCLCDWEPTFPEASSPDDPDTEMPQYRAHLAARIVQARAGEGALRERYDAAVEAVLIADGCRTDPIPLDLADALNELRHCRFGTRAALTDTAGDPT